MGGKTVLIVPAKVPAATVLRVERRATARPDMVRAEPAPVPGASPVRLVSDVITPEQVAQLRAENAELRHELERVRAS